MTLARGVRAYWIAIALIHFSMVATQHHLAQAAVSVVSKGDRHWTIADLVEAPTITEISLDPGAENAAYIVRSSQIEANSRRDRLDFVNLKSGKRRTLLSANLIENIQRHPDGDGWSLLADIGSGVQLYRIDSTGKISPIVVVSPGGLYGWGISGAVGYSNSDPPRTFGVRSYGWAPEGRGLWYTAVRPPRQFQQPFAFDDDSSPSVGFLNPGEIELRVRSAKGEDHLVNARPTTWSSIAEFMPDLIQWASDGGSLFYTIVKYAGELESYEFDLKNRRSRLTRSGDRSDTDYVKSIFKGPRGLNGGDLSNREGRLIETAVGQETDYGPILDVELSRRSVWFNESGRMAVVGVSHQGKNARNGLMVLKRRGSPEFLGGDDNLDTCDVDANLAHALCVRQSVTRPPEIVSVDLSSGQVEMLVEAEQRYSSIAPLQVEPFTHGQGEKTVSGFIYYPRNYQPGQRYPAIFVTHYQDARNLFINPVNDWEYPVPVLVERGYVVVTINEPSMLPDVPESGPRERQDRKYLRVVRSFEEVARYLAAQRIIDAESIGIAGYSRGSQIVNLLMTQSRLFKAASSGDGGWLNAGAYFSSFAGAKDYGKLFGGSPYSRTTWENYRRLSPTFRADLASGPILHQVALFISGQVELHMSLLEAGRPSELIVFPRETHLFHQPRNRQLAMEQNVDWFDFWLRDKENFEPRKEEQYKRWRKLRELNSQAPVIGDCSSPGSLLGVDGC